MVDAGRATLFAGFLKKNAVISAFSVSRRYVGSSPNQVRNNQKWALFDRKSYQ